MRVEVPPLKAGGLAVGAHAVLPRRDGGVEGRPLVVLGCVGSARGRLVVVVSQRIILSSRPSPRRVRPSLVCQADLRLRHSASPEPRGTRIGSGQAGGVWE